MARVRGGNTGFAVALVIFGCAFVISLLVAIILYTKIETHKNAETAAKSEMTKYVKSTETGAAGDYIGDGQSAVGGMLVEIQTLKDALSKKDREIATLRSENERMESAFNDESKKLVDADASRKTEVDEHKRMMAQRQDQVNQLIREKDELAAQISKLQASVIGDIQDADQAARDRIAELTQQVGELENTVREREGDIVRLTNANEGLRDKLPKLPEPNTTLPDGRVASVFGSGRDLFINLGRNDGLVIGMTFEVFDPLPVIRLNSAGEPRGKATIEVYKLEPEAATCRVVRMNSGEQIDPNDPVVNIAYDPNMEIKMFAFGAFDVEYDGGTNDIGRINNLITGNGGIIPELKVGEDGIPILSPDLSYLVLGAEPVLPEKPGDDVFDSEIIEAYRKKKAEVEAYFSLVDNAKLLRIPVLSQERFLELVGYYVR